MLKETKLGKKTRENIGIHRKSMQNSIVYAKEKLIKASSCRRICVQHIYILTPFWKAIEWIWIMLFRARLKVSRRWRFQKMPSGTEVNEFPERSRLFNDPVKLCSSSRWRSEMRLSNKRKRGVDLRLWRNLTMLWMAYGGCCLRSHSEMV